MSRRGCLLLIFLLVLLPGVTYATTATAQAANHIEEGESVTLETPSDYCETSKETDIGSKYSKIATLSGSCSNHEGGILSLSASLYTGRNNNIRETCNCTTSKHRLRLVYC